MYLILLAKNLILLVLGCLLIAFGSLNITMSEAPENIDQITQNYGNTYAMKITPISDSPEDTVAEIKTSTKNAHILMVLSLVAGIYLVFYSLFEILICKFYVV